MGLEECRRQTLDLWSRKAVGCTKPSSVGHSHRILENSGAESNVQWMPRSRGFREEHHQPLA